MGPSANLLRRHVQHHRRVRHRHLERGSPQDRVWLQPDGPRLPRPGPLGQCPGRAEGSGHHRGGVSTKRLNPECVKQGQRLQTGNPVGNCRLMEIQNLKKKKKKQLEMMDQANQSSLSRKVWVVMLLSQLHESVLMGDCGPGPAGCRSTGHKHLSVR